MFHFVNFLFIISSFISTDSLNQNSFTRRFTDYVLDNGPRVGWQCGCPPVNQDNLCLCHKEGVTNEPVPIEAPYAAILIQRDIDGDNGGSSIDLWSASDVRINMGGSADRNIYLNQNVSSNEPTLQRIKLMPKDDLLIRYLIAQSSDVANPLVYSELSFRKLFGFTEKFNEIIIMIPGWQSSIDSVHAVFSLFAASPKILVNWLDGNQYFFQENERIYEQAVANTVYAGYHLGIYLEKAIQRGIFNDIHIVGFDIGSYVAHFAAKYLSDRRDSGFGDESSNSFRINRLTALDPPRYLFEDDPLSVNDANYVEIYHSNVGYEDEDGSIDLVKSLLSRKFGESRQLGHASIYINLMNPDDVFSGHTHPQCIPGNGDDTPLYGCSSMMAARFFIDSFRKGTVNEFNGISIGSNDEHPFGFYATSLAEGSFYAKYDKTVCKYPEIELSIQESSLVNLTIQSKFIDPNEQLVNRREKLTPPIEDPVTLDEVNEENANCGQLSSNSNYTSRIYEGRNATENQFPFVVCIEMKPVILWKYKYIVFYDFMSALLYPRPDYYKPDHGIISTRERISENSRYDLGDDFISLCTGSLIDKTNGWIVTAAHCFGGIINEQQIRFSIGTADCNTNDDKKMVIKVELEGVKTEKDVFIHQNTLDVWNEMTEKYEDDMASSKYGKLLTNDELEEYEDDIVTEQEAEEFINNYPTRKKLEGISDETPLCEEVEKVNHPTKFAPKDVYKSDIALIKIPVDKLSNYPASNEICFKSSIAFNYDNFNQFFYYAGYGSKGVSDYTQDTRTLSWLNNLNSNELSQRFNKTIIMSGYPFIGVAMKHDQSLVVNVEQSQDKLFMASILCAGDSGGPHFVYGNVNGAKYTLLVGVHSSGSNFKSFGDVVVRRGSSSETHNYCAEQLLYNVYGKRYFKAPSIFTNVASYVDWIDSVINPDEDGGPRKKIKVNE